MDCKDTRVSLTCPQKESFAPRLRVKRHQPEAIRLRDQSHRQPAHEKDERFPKCLDEQRRTASANLASKGSRASLNGTITVSPLTFVKPSRSSPTLGSSVHSHSVKTSIAEILHSAASFDPFASANKLSTTPSTEPCSWR